MRVGPDEERNASESAQNLLDAPHVPTVRGELKA